MTDKEYFHLQMELTKLIERKIGTPKDGYKKYLYSIVSSYFSTSKSIKEWVGDDLIKALEAIDFLLLKWKENSSNELLYLENIKLEPKILHGEKFNRKNKKKSPIESKETALFKKFKDYIKKYNISLNQSVTNVHRNCTENENRKNLRIARSSVGSFMKELNLKK